MITFDTLSYARKLKAAGFTEQQAEAQADALREVIVPELATRQDLTQGLKDLEHRLTIRMGAMLSIAVGILTVLIKVL